MVAWVAFLGVLVVCVGMSLVFTAYICMLWYANSRVQSSAPTDQGAAAAATMEKKGVKGMSVAELEKLPGVEDGGTMQAGTECAVCLDDIETGQTARILPECRHVFHRNCADAWLANNAVCPLCRAVPVTTCS